MNTPIILHHTVAYSDQQSKYSTTVVLIHGLDSGSDTWEPFIPLLLQQAGAAGLDLRVVAVDLRGHGASGMPAGEFSAQTLAKDVWTTLQYLDPFPEAHNLYVVGHSMGARVAVAFARDYSQWVKGLVIEDMDLRPRQYPDLTDNEKASLEKFARLFPNKEAVVRCLVDEYGYDEERIRGYAELGRRIRPLHDGNWWSGINPKAARLACSNVLSRGRQDFVEMVESLNNTDTVLCKALLIYAGKSTVCAPTGPGSAAEMAQLCPSLGVQYLEACGHSIHREAKEDMCKFVMDHIQS